MYIMLFEDDKKTPSSQLLLYSYNGDNIYFSGGGGALKKKVNDLLYSGITHILVFVDINPNNPQTVGLLEYLMGTEQSIRSGLILY